MCRCRSQSLNLFPEGLFWVLANKKSVDPEPSVRASKATKTLLRLECP